jgi:beta-mannosidase
MIEQSLDGEWALREAGSSEWIPARVPGGVHLDLLAAGRIADPFVGDEELRTAWVAERDWEYRREFIVDPAVASLERVELAFDGLDTLAEVALNREPIGSADNMFRSWRWNVTGRLRDGANELVVVFHSAVARARELDAARHLDTVADQLPGAPYLRKAPAHFGWDWGPRLPNLGIWQGVRLQGWRAARLRDVQPRQIVDDGRARIEAAVEVDRLPGADGELVVSLGIEHPDGRIQRVTSVVVGDVPAVRLGIDVDDPRLWWPNGLGEQPLYGVQVDLSAGAATLDRRTYRVGLRTVELRREPDEHGESLEFVVNGVPLFARGANWIPADVFPARADAARLASLLEAAAAANHNMIRAWGGGYYELDAFYEACDRLGILVWQDFMFACSVYPLHDPTFLENVRAEVEEQVRRLRHHSCLALWCGNNEMERGWTDWGWDRPGNDDLRAAYTRFFSCTLPAWVTALDPATPYWPSSPSSGQPLEQPIGAERGDEHEWTVWHGLAPFARYARETPRFVSEFGFESLPAPATIAAFAHDPAEWTIGSPLLDHHQRCPAGNARILYYLAEQFRLPHDFDSLVYLSQVLQAEALRVGAEHWRRERGRCGGALYWQLNDCWPVSSWSSIDYFGRWKALHYASRRFFEPVLLSCSVQGGVAAVAVTNDLVEPCRGELGWSLERLDGVVLESGRSDVIAAPLGTTVVVAVPLPADPAARRNTVLVAELWRDRTKPSLVVQPFVPDKHLDLARSPIEFEVVAAGDGTPGEPATNGRATVRLRSDSLARWVELSLDGADTIFDDNYFDIPAGRPAQVSFELPAGWTLERACDAFRIRSVADTYR